jgi:hypothetical protein
MITLVKNISSRVKDAYRLIKVLRYGEKDIREVDESAPFGYDGRAPKDWIAVYADTGANDSPVILGWLNKKQLSSVGVGDVRLYSTNAAGDSMQFYMWLKNDGTAEIGGDADNMVRYSKLEDAFNQLKSDFNSLVNTFNSHTHLYNPGPNSPVASAAPASPGNTSNADITPAKIDEIKTM